MTPIEPLGPTPPVGPAAPSAPAGAPVAGPAAAAVSGPALATLAQAAAEASAQASLPAPSPATALEQATRTAATLQGGLPDLLADLAAALSDPASAAAAPASVRAAAAQALAAALPLDPAPTSDDLQQAAARSGLFLEARLAAGLPPASGDVKAALLTLRQALQGWSAGQAATPGGQPSASVRPAPPPPYAGGATAAQAAADPRLPASAEAVPAHLARLTTAALSRQVLMQAASAAKSDARTGTTRWLFELPLETPQGAATAQFEIDREATSSHDDDELVWRTAFSLDVGDGPVHARLSLSGGRVRAKLWAEDETTRARLHGDSGGLLAAFRNDGLEAEVAVFPGRPASVPTPPGRFLDRDA